MKIPKKVLDIALITIIIGSVGWFLIHEYTRHEETLFTKDTRVEEIMPDEVVSEKRPGMDWAPLVPGITSIGVFLFKYYWNQKKKKKPKEVFLEDHILFDTIEELINNEIPYMQFGSEGRTEVFRALICEQLETFRDGLKDFISENSEFESGTVFRKNLRQQIYKIVGDCETEWQARQIPQVVIDKYNHFFRGRIDLLLSDITMSSLRYSGRPEQALEAFLNEVRTVFKLHLQVDAQHALNNMNGELNGLTYNGKKL